MTTPASATLTAARLAAAIDHTLLKPEAAPVQIDQLCDEAIRWNFAAVCVNPLYVARCAARLRGTPAAVATVCGFPLGATTTADKCDETRRAVESGATEVDMVLRIGELIAGEHRAVRDDVAAVVDATRRANPRALVKVIFETAVLNPGQIIAGCRCCAEAQADYVKTSTGFHPSGGATVEAVRLMHKHAAPIKVKAAGGIRTLDAAKAMLDAGASRLGMSAGVALMKELTAGS
jgi:deoxyribose-phosphate aldolase